VLAGEASHPAAVGRLPAKKLGGRWWLDERAVRERLAEEARWVSMVDAAAIVGCHPKTVLEHAKAGDIEQRQANRGSPSLLRTSVEAFGVRWRAVAGGGGAAVCGPVSRSPRPSEDGHEWIGVAEVAELLRVSTTRVGQMARADRVPWIEHGGRRWFRRDLIEGVAAARAFARGVAF